MVYLTNQLPEHIVDELPLDTKLSYYRNSAEIKATSVKKRTELLNDFKTSSSTQGFYFIDYISQGFCIRFELKQDVIDFMKDFGVKWKLQN